VRTTANARGTAWWRRRRGAATGRALHAGRVAGWLALAGALLVAAGALLPLPPELLAEGPDNAIGATLHYAAAQRYGVGTRLVSSFGPLGFVFYPYYLPATFGWLLAIRFVLASASCGTLAWIGCAAWGSPWGGAVALFACAPLLATSDVWFLTLPILSILIELPEGRVAPVWLRVLLGAGIGLVSLIKFTALLAAVVVLLPLTVSALLLRRRVPVVTAAAVSVAVVGWYAAGQHLVDWVRFLDWSVGDVAGAYSNAMHLPVAPSLVLHAAAVSVAVFAAATALIRRRLRGDRWAAAAALGAALYLLFKAGFVRADDHVFITTFGLFVTAVPLAVVWGRRPRQRLVGALLVVLVPGGLWWHAVAVLGPPRFHLPPVFPAQAIRRLTAGPAAWWGDALDRAHADRLAQIRAARPLPALQGPVDVYSYDQVAMLAHGLDLRPRPIFQSYMAYSPRQARANAEFLLGDLAPEWIFFRVSPIDLRVPALEDAPSWPLLLSRYRLVGPAGAFALLQRRETPLPWRLEPLGHVETATNRAIRVPAAGDGRIWVRIDVGTTWRDRLREALLWAPLTYVIVQRGDGRSRFFRLIPGLAREGFLLSPLVEDTADFMRLMTSGAEPAGAGDAADRIMVGTAPGALTEDTEELGRLAMRSGAPALDDATGLTAGAVPRLRPVSVDFFRLLIGEPPAAHAESAGAP
jgi:hypothetical protein